MINDWGIELPNQEKIRTLHERETCKYLGILKAALSKKWRWKKKKRKERISREQESYSKLINIKGTLWKGLLPWLSLS